MKTLFKNELELIKEGKLEEAVKFMPKVSLEEGIKRTIDWYKQH